MTNKQTRVLNIDDLSRKLPALTVQPQLERLDWTLVVKLLSY